MKLLLLFGIIYCSQVSSFILPIFNPISMATNGAQLKVDIGKNYANMGFSIAQKSVNLARAITNAVVGLFGHHLIYRGANLGFNIADKSLCLAKDITNTVLNSVRLGFQILGGGSRRSSRELEGPVSGVGGSENPSEKMEELQKKVFNALGNAQNSMQDIVNDIKKNTDVVMSEGLNMAHKMPVEVLSQFKKVADEFQNAMQQPKSSPETVMKDLQNEVEKTMKKDKEGGVSE